ncbi:MAG: OmpA family protein [Ignavibacteria bacterium]|nr:OmpA family protein [Ignavibacteria bacterium]MBT8392542.1 OmpA family protein [Ignavibacteria bacterium]NNL22804.1 OmpA family protein [Ignavibacteriaceae bacterium]
MKSNFTLSKKMIDLFVKISILFLLVQNSNILFGQPKEKKIFHPLMGSISLSIETGTTIGYTDYTNSKLDFVWRISGEYFFNTFTNHLVGFRGFAGSGMLGGNDIRKEPKDFKTDLRFFGAGFTYGYIISNKFSPTITTAFSYLNFNPKDRNGNQLLNNENSLYNKNVVNLVLEAGLQYSITKNFSVKLSYGFNFNFNDWLDDINKGSQNDLFSTIYLGLSYTINAREDADRDGVDDSEDMCLDTPEGLEVDKNGCPTDTDKDGVPDYLDQCSNTPQNVLVYDNGCPLDSDRDGVPDFADRCPNTPPNVKVNRNGCAQDSDYDGIADYEDRCPETPRGVRVDSVGCPFDSDGDTVPDFADRCPNTPSGVQVNNSGCPMDSDRDGIPDYLDKCPNTISRNSVDSDGCTDTFQEYIFRVSDSFNEGTTNLNPNYYNELIKVVSRMKKTPNAKWRIEGHTDDKGDAQYKKILSLQRAKSVFEYFISQGLREKNFEIVGLGKDFPIADNNTAEGRKLNRRVVLIRAE